MRTDSQFVLLSYHHHSWWYTAGHPGKEGGLSGDSELKLPTPSTLCCSPWGRIRAFTGALAAFTISFSIFRSSSPTRETERPALPARAVRPTRCT